jgi:conjugative transfer pilus assembly protein TraH
VKTASSFSISVALILAMLTPLPTSAGLQDELDGMFDTLVNVTEPTAHFGQRRGAITGGSLVMRNGITNTNLVSFVPPSFSAGCGGIDLYGGSFSFINFDQFVHLLRNIASNAAGYAFQLALGAMCKDCQNVMNYLQRQIQELNQMFSNSCRLAQGIVNDTVRAFELQKHVELSEVSFTKGIADVFSAFTNTSTAGDPVKQVKENAPDEMTKVIQGNLVWRALKKHNAGAWFRFGGDELLEAVMSVTGSIIVSEPQASPDGQGENTPISVLPEILSIRHLINGSGDGPYQKVKVYRCDGHNEDECLHPVPQDVSLTGLRQRVAEILLGSGNAGDGLIQKFATGEGELTDSEKAFMETVPSAIGGILRNLAREDAGMAKLFADEAGPVIALELAQIILNDMMAAVRAAAALEDHAYAKRLNDTLTQAREAAAAEYEALSGRYGNPQTLMAFYQNLMNAAKARNYASNVAAPANSPAWPAK